VRPGIWLKDRTRVSSPPADALGLMMRQALTAKPGEVVPALYGDGGDVQAGGGLADRS